MKRKFLSVILIVAMLLLIMMPIGLAAEGNLTNIQENRTEPELIAEEDQTLSEDSASDFEYSISNEKVTITKYKGTKTELEIPSTIEGCPVTSIGEYSFYKCNTITSVTIPNGVTSIGTNAFYECNNLTSITISKDVTTIGRGAPFALCSNLTQINVDTNNQKYSSEDGILFNKNKTQIVRYPEGKKDMTYTIPSTVTSIGAYAFYNNNNLTSVIVPNNVTSIGEWAFVMCTSLTSVNIPNGIKTIEERTFDNCISLTSITIPNSVTSIGDCAFRGCRSLTNDVAIPNSVTSIGEFAFGYCSSLENINVDSNNQYYSDENGVLFNKNKTKLIQYPDGKKDVTYTIPSTVTSIGVYAFYPGTNLTSVIIPNTVTSINEYAFWEYGNVTIHGYKNSTAQKYANTYNINFKLILDDYLLGDVTGDGRITYADYAMILAHVDGNKLITDETALKAADVTGDGKITYADYAKVLAHVEGRISLW